MMKSLKRILAALLLVTLLCAPVALASSKAKVVVGSMKVYNKKKKCVGTIGRGKSVTVTGKSGSWVRLKFRGKTLYAKASGIAYNSATKAVTKRDTSFSFVTKSSWKKSKYYKATLAAGSVVYICGTSGSKYLVTNKTKTAYGYIKKSDVQKG